MMFYRYYYQFKVYLEVKFSTFFFEILITSVVLFLDPNIASALNHQAAELWENPVLFKKYLIDKYEKDVTNNLNNNSNSYK